MSPRRERWHGSAPDGARPACPTARPVSRRSRLGPAAAVHATGEAGKVAYDGYCAVCHGSTLTNGTFGTPLAGEYFRRQWGGRTVAELFDKSRSTMPPAAGSLPDATYADILAYVLEVNGGARAGTDLPADAARLAVWRVP